MNKLFVVFAVMLASSMNAQTIRKTISSKKINVYLECEKIMKVENGDTTNYIYCSFPNAEYPALKDRGSVYFSNQTDLNEFRTKLNEASSFVGQKVSTEIKGNGYLLFVPEKGKNITFYDSEGKYMMINQSMIEKWIEWLNANDFGN